MAALLKKLSLEADRPAGVKEVVAMVKEGGIAALKVRLALVHICVCMHPAASCAYRACGSTWLCLQGVIGRP